MVTWPDIAEAEDLPVEPEPEEVYDLRGPSEDAIELALELADYCDLDGRHRDADPPPRRRHPVRRLDRRVDELRDLHPLARLSDGSVG